MKADPKPRADNRCSGCGKPRPVETMRRFAGAQGEADPWCSSTCCRRAWGCELVKLDNRGREVTGNTL